MKDLGSGKEDVDVSSAVTVPELHRGCKKERYDNNEEDLNLGYEAGYHSYKARKRHKKEFTPEELTNMIRLHREEGLSQKDVAQAHSVRPHFVAALLRNEKLGKNGIR